MQRTLALITLAIGSFGALASTSTVSAADCPKGTIASTQSDGTVRCAKLTLVDPNARGISRDRTPSVGLSRGPPHQGISEIIVPMDTPGIGVRTGEFESFTQSVLNNAGEAPIREGAGSPCRSAILRVCGGTCRTIAPGSRDHPMTATPTDQPDDRGRQ